MAISTSLLFPNELRICKNHEKTKQFKSIMGQGNLHLMKLRFSSKAVRQDSLSICLSNNVYPRRNSVPYGRNAFKCHAFLAPDQTFQLPSIKTVSMALTRSYNTLQGSPPLLKLLPAVGIICFALWGLQPLMHQLRKLVIHKNDNNWKKSRTYYFMSSYLQPLMLWTAATLICRTLDPIVLSSEASQVVKQRMLVFVSSLSTVLAFAYSLSSLILQTQNFFMETTDPGDARNMGFQFAGKAVYSAVWVAAVSLFMELLGFSTQKWLTAGGLGTVLLTLAGREIFTNFLSSAMIHATRPFVVNEWIQTKIEGYDVSGTVEHVGWWSPTIVRGEDREAVHIPNHKFTMNVVRNLSHKTHWRIKTHLAISHLDVNKINNIVADMRKVLAKNPQVEQQRLHRRVFLENINPENQALMILVSCFIKTSHHEEYLCVKEGIFLDLLRVISHHRARLATPIRTIQKIYSEGDLENAFTGDGVPPNRSLLLIEPPYKVNGEDKSKSQNRSARTNGEQENIKAKTKPASDNTKTDIMVGTKTSDIKDDSKVGESLTSDNKMAKNPTPKASKTESKAAETSSTDPTKIANNKTDNPKITTPKRVMEDNIVLGVALDGSKRTLPIEEDEVSPTISTPSEGKELAVLRNGNVSTTLTEKDKTDNSVSAAPSATTSGDV